MSRLLGRIVLIVGALLAPLWMCALSLDALGGEPVVRDVASSIGSVEAAATEDPASMAPADCAEEDVGAAAELDDDDADAAEVLSPAGAPRVHPSNRSGPARIGKRAGAGPPLVHLDAQTPPPRA